MRCESEALRLEEICEEILKTKHLEKTHVIWLTQLFGNRFKHAQEAVSEKKVKKYFFKPSERTIWIVVGKNREYQVIPLANFCSCDDFYFRVVDNQIYICYHLLAQRLAEALGSYDIIEVPDDFYAQLMEKWKNVQIKEAKIPKEELKNLRNYIEKILTKDMIENHQLLAVTQEAGFDVTSTKQLATLLSTDPKKRFLCKNGVWSLKDKQNCST